MITTSFSLREGGFDKNVTSFTFSPISTIFQLIDILHGTVINTLQVKSLTSLEFRCFQGCKVLFKQGLKVSCWQLHHIPQTLAELMGSSFAALSVTPKGDREWESLDTDQPALESTLSIMKNHTSAIE